MPDDAALMLGCVSLIFSDDRRGMTRFFLSGCHGGLMDPL
jgi:hypothetical protein